MATFIALLRAVNLGSHNKVAMSDLRELLLKLGMADGQSILQSGNLVFGSDVRATAELERLLEAGAEKRLGLKTDFMVRSAKEWKALIEANPFPREARLDPGHLVALVTKAAPAPAAVAELQKSIKGREVVKAVGRCVYMVYPDGIGSSRLTGAVLDRRLGTSGTGRNWNTVLKLGALTTP
ncbi:MAG: DUF1697 domain-containing protein [Vicinamibacterales bacterium]